MGREFPSQVAAAAVCIDNYRAETSPELCEERVNRRTQQRAEGGPRGEAAAGGMLLGCSHFKFSVRNMRANVLLPRGKACRASAGCWPRLIGELTADNCVSQ